MIASLKRRLEEKEQAILLLEKHIKSVGTQTHTRLGNNVSHTHVTYKLHACKSHLAQMDVVIEVHMQVISADKASHVVTKSLSLCVCVSVCVCVCPFYSVGSV